MAWSTPVSCLQAAISPAGVASATASTMASAVMVAVTPKREAMASDTGSPVRIEVPRSARTTLPTQIAYWTGIGRF